MNDYFVSADAFETAFASAWREFCAAMEEKGQTEAVIHAYGGSKSWTDCMFSQGNELFGQGPLYRTLAKLNEERSDAAKLQARREDNKFDLAFVGGNRMLGDDRGWGYASHFHVLIEHENELRRIQEEFWKMRNWRSDLKVVIGYEWLGSGGESQDLKKAIEDLKKFFTDRHALAVSPREQYIFLYGSRRETNVLPKWHVARPGESAGRLIC